MTFAHVRGFFWITAGILTLLSQQIFAAPPPGSVRIENFTVRGNGCQQGTVAANLSQDHEALTLIFADYLTEIEPGRVGFELNSKKCNVSIEFSAPRGWRFAPFCVEYRGYASLDRGVFGRQTTSYRFRQSRRRLPRMNLRGPFEDDYRHLTQIQLQPNRGWSACRGRRKLNLKTSIGLAKLPGNPESGGLMTVDSIDGSISQHYGIAWRRCR